MPVRLPPRVRERIPVVCVVYNDRGLGNERAFQKKLYGSRYFAVDYVDVDFAALVDVVIDQDSHAPVVFRR